MSVKSVWSNASFRACVSLLIICQHDLSVAVSGVLKSSAVIVLLSVSPFKAVSVALYIEMILCWVHIYLQLFYLLELTL